MKIWVGITGLKNPIIDPHRSLCYNYYGIELQDENGLDNDLNQSINQSTLFKHGKWLSKLVFRHADVKIKTSD